MKWRARSSKRNLGNTTRVVSNQGPWKRCLDALGSQPRLRSFEKCNSCWKKLMFDCMSKWDKVLWLSQKKPKKTHFISSHWSVTAITCICSVNKWHVFGGFYGYIDCAASSEQNYDLSHSSVAHWRRSRPPVLWERLCRDGHVIYSHERQHPAEQCTATRWSLSFRSPLWLICVSGLCYTG